MSGRPESRDYPSNQWQHNANQFHQNTQNTNANGQPRNPRQPGNNRQSWSYQAPKSPWENQQNWNRANTNTYQDAYQRTQNTNPNSSSTYQNAFHQAQNLFQRLQNQTGTDTPPRSRSVAGVLGIIVGAFGAHNFYLGRYQIATVQLALTVGSLFSFAPFIAAWGIFEGIMYLTSNTPRWQVDGWNRPLLP
ncbi:MAG: TM2 domain-containing protein [Actinomycetaceae bacterium]|nr:TM2 domain-containing protein [Actinomycetaceae bacterium]